MHRYELIVGWEMPILPSKNDPPDLNKEVNRDFRKWLISVSVKEGDKSILCSVCFLGFYVRLFLTYLIQRSKGE